VQRPGVDLRRASGLPPADLIRDPVRVQRVRALSGAASGSPVLPSLVRLAGRVAGCDCAQLSLLADQQIATAVRCSDSSYDEEVGALEDSLCTVAVLSGDVLVAADARTHPWLHDLPPVTSGAVGAYVGVPLRLRDQTVVGALCVYGPEPRAWTDSEIVLTCDVADVVALELQRLDALRPGAASAG
jgi:GAF domain-containing protein